MKKILMISCLASLFAFTCISQETMIYSGFNLANDSEDISAVSSFLDSADIAFAANEAETDIRIFPSSFDLRDYGIVSHIKDQGDYGTCWAIAASDSLETQIIRNGYEAGPDLSEWHLAYFTYNGPKAFFTTAEDVFDTGGTNTIAAASLARWQGMVKESRVPYSSAHMLPGSMQFQNDYKVTDVLNLHSLMSTHIKHSVDFMKELVYNQNTVAATYFSSTKYYNEATASQYCWDEGTGIDHAVIIMGWDDNYPKENFRSGSRPSGNGAWLVKNSWGTDFGNDGYFWISYEDKSLCEAGCYFCVPADTYSTNYQYDETGWCASVSPDGNQRKLSGYMSNVFTAENNDPVTAVGFYTTEDDADYEITVYTGVKINASKPSPVNGKAVSSASGTQKYSGYHTVILDTPVNVTEGETFSVSVKLTNHTSPYVLPMEASSAVVSSGFFSSRTYLFHQYASLENDPSYISQDGITWYQTTGKSYSYTSTGTKYLGLTSSLRNLRSVVLGNVCVKALASPAGTVPEYPLEPAPPESVRQPDPVLPPVTTTEATVTSVSAADAEVTSPVTTTPVSVTEVTSAVTSSVTEPVVTTPVTTPAVTTTPVTTTEEPPLPPLSDNIYDINKDGKVSSADLILMINLLNGKQTGEYLTDINEDGVTNIVDLILLKEYLTGTVYSDK